MLVSLDRPKTIMVLRKYIAQIDDYLASNHSSKYTFDFRQFEFDGLTTFFLVSIWLEELVKKYEGKLFGVYGNSNAQNYFLSKFGVLNKYPPKLIQQTPEAIFERGDEIFMYSSLVGGGPSGVESRLACKIADLFKAEFSTHANTRLIELTSAAITEALANVCNWAYQTGQWHPLKKRWWLMGAINADKTRLRIKVLDQGESLPIHFTRNRLTDATTRTLLNVDEDMSDADAIATAFELGANRQAEMQGRRRGLIEMRELIKEFTEGTFFVYSGNGHYRCHTKSGITLRSKKIENALQFNGTLIGWELIK